MKYLASTFLGAALFTASAGLLAQPPRGILSLDSDGDGAVSREEFRLPAKRPGPRMLHRADTNDDGVISRDEVLSQLGDAPEDRADRMLAMFDSMDTDGNGVVTQPELEDRAFARVDSDGDGFVTEAEARAMHEQRHAMREKWGQRPEHGRGRMPAAPGESTSGDES